MAPCNRSTIFIVDDDHAVRAALQMLLETTGHTVMCFDSAAEFLDIYRGEWPGCLVLDVRMPNMSGLELQEELTRKKLQIPIVFMTGHGDVPMSVKALKAGAVDFVEKPFHNEVMLTAIQDALHHDSVVRQEDGQKLLVQERYSRLTSREREVMALLTLGLSNKEIGQQLNVSHRTVETHRARILAKMETHSVAELVLVAVECGLEPPGHESDRADRDSV